MSRLIKFITRPWRTRAHMRRSMEVLREVRRIKHDAKVMADFVAWGILMRSFDPSMNYHDLRH